MSDIYRWEPVDAEHPLRPGSDDEQIVEDSYKELLQLAINYWHPDGRCLDDDSHRIIRILRPVTDPDGEWQEVSDANPLTEADAGPVVRVRGKDWEFSGPARWDNSNSGTYKWGMFGDWWAPSGSLWTNTPNPMDITHIYRPKPTRPTWKQISETEWDFGGQRLIKVFDKHFAWLSGVGNLDRSADDEVARMSVEEVWEHLNRKAPK